MSNIYTKINHSLIGTVTKEEGREGTWTCFHIASDYHGRFLETQYVAEEELRYIDREWKANK